MKKLLEFSSRIKPGRGNKSFKKKLPKEAVIHITKELREYGFNSKQIHSILMETRPMKEQEIFLMHELPGNKDLLEIRAMIDSAMQYGLIEEVK